VHDAAVLCAGFMPCASSIHTFITPAAPTLLHFLVCFKLFLLGMTAELFSCPVALMVASSCAGGVTPAASLCALCVATSISPARQTPHFTLVFSSSTSLQPHAVAAAAVAHRGWVSTIPPPSPSSYAPHPCCR
jgi:hypothetical protein